MSAVLLVIVAAAALLLGAHSQPVAPAAGSAAPCDRWEKLLGHNAVHSLVHNGCNTKGQKPPCAVSKNDGKKYYLLGKLVFWFFS